MKPEWKDAPEWANWLAMDQDNWWYWYEFKPGRTVDCWYIKKSIEKFDIVIYTPNINMNWKNSLEKRPEELNDK